MRIVQRAEDALGHRGLVHGEPGMYRPDDEIEAAEQVCVVVERTIGENVGLDTLALFGPLRRDAACYSATATSTAVCSLQLRNRPRSGRAEERAAEGSKGGRRARRQRRRRGPKSERSERAESSLYPRERPELLNDLVKLPLGQIDLGRGAFRVEKAGAHADRDLIEIADLAEDLIGGMTESDKPALFRQGPPIPQQNILLREPASERERLLARSAGECSAVGQADVIPRFIGEPEPADVLDAVEDDATAHIEASAVVIERCDLRLYGLVGHGALLDDWEW